jgi:hypothetical protein
MKYDKTNVERLIEAGILVDTNLTDDGRDKIDGIDLSDSDIKVLVSIKKKLKLDPLELSGPGKKKTPGSGMHAWRL